MYNGHTENYVAIGNREQRLFGLSGPKRPRFGGFWALIVSSCLFRYSTSTVFAGQSIASHSRYQTLRTTKDGERRMEDFFSSFC